MSSISPDIEIHGIEKNAGVKTSFIDQDSKQRIMTFFKVIAELYKLLASSLLLIFVPQKCGE